MIFNVVVKESACFLGTAMSYNDWLFKFCEIILNFIKQKNRFNEMIYVHELIMFLFQIQCLNILREICQRYNRIRTASQFFFSPEKQKINTDDEYEDGRSHSLLILAQRFIIFFSGNSVRKLYATAF